VWKEVQPGYDIQQKISREGSSAMVRHTAKIITIAGGLMAYSAQAADRINITQPLPQLNCAGDFCQVTIPLGTLNYVDGSGNTATVLSDVVFTIIRFAAQPGSPLQTNYILNFNQYNRTHDVPAGSEGIDFRFLDSTGNVLSDDQGRPVEAPVVFDRSTCRDQGHQVFAGNLIDIFARGAKSFNLTQSTLYRDQDQC
jgi:hypothetical protein